MIHKKKVCKNCLPTVFTPFLPKFFWYFGTPQPTGLGSRSLRQLAGSLEMANLAVRHVDTELAEATKHAYQQAPGEVGGGYSTKMLRFRAPMKIARDVFCFFVCTSSGIERCVWCAFFYCCFCTFLWNSFCLKGVLCVAISTFRSWYYVCSL